MKDENNTNEVIAALAAGCHVAVGQTAEAMVDAIDRGFGRGRDALGRPWAPLAPETIRRKGNSQVLIGSGDLRESFDYEMRGYARARVYSDDPKAWYHETGVPENNLPARPMMAPAVALAARSLIPSSFEDAVGSALDSAGGL